MDSEIVKLGKKGQLSLTKRAMSRLGLEGGETLLLDVTEDGAIELRPAGVYPLVEIYGDSRIEEFLEEDGLSEEEKALSRAFHDDDRSSVAHRPNCLSKLRSIIPVPALMPKRS